MFGVVFRFLETPATGLLRGSSAGDAARALMRPTRALLLYANEMSRAATAVEPAPRSGELIDLRIRLRGGDPEAEDEEVDEWRAAREAERDEKNGAGSRAGAGGAGAGGEGGAAGASGTGGVGAVSSGGVPDGSQIAPGRRAELLQRLRLAGAWGALVMQHLAGMLQELEAKAPAQALAVLMPADAMAQGEQGPHSRLAQLRADLEGVAAAFKGAERAVEAAQRAAAAAAAAALGVGTGMGMGGTVQEQHEAMEEDFDFD
ncbi:hypothetical protein MNEG_6271 [Monoraphidium neglectum]|jgi:hypothetical protein|uniref:Uncharacterized protein n=1 Tax=Monoraphidium neglectum TaxID=145388 RepID=A0A0D2MEY3_9CHLO|nr:hypothetical protein MNEG_6271 [Monoraphidium neglectum]KIZ01690.1 hypothetical protein MNEG_6271 [Monoraphidium neglectum]|eukprot:XP_013900709.1 hypothetical protein MNEG_6271 [Monoraphidium neglectum]